MVGLVDYSKRKAETTTTTTSSSAGGATSCRLSPTRTRNGNSNFDAYRQQQHQRIPQQRRPTGAVLNQRIQLNPKLWANTTTTSNPSIKQQDQLSGVNKNEEKNNKKTGSLLEDDPTPSDSLDALFSTPSGGEGATLITKLSKPFHLRRGKSEGDADTLSMSKVNNLQYRHEIPERQKTEDAINKRIQIGELRASLEKTDQEEEELNNQRVQAVLQKDLPRPSSSLDDGGSNHSASSVTKLPSPFQRAGKSLRKASANFFQRCGTSELVREHRNRRPTTLREMSHRNVMMTMGMSMNTSLMSMGTSDRQMSCSSLLSDSSMPTQEEGEEEEDAYKKNNMSDFEELDEEDEESSSEDPEEEMVEEEKVPASRHQQQMEAPLRRPSQIDWSQPSRRTVPQRTPSQRGSGGGGLDGLLSLRKSISVRSVSSADAAGGADHDDNNNMPLPMPKLKASVSLSDLPRHRNNSFNAFHKHSNNNSTGGLDSSNNSCCSFTLRRHHRKADGDDDNSISSVNRLEQSLFNSNNNDKLANNNKLIAPLSPLTKSKRSVSTGGVGDFGMRRSTSSSAAYGVLMMQNQPNRGRCLSPGNTTSRQQEQQDRRRSLSPCLLRAGAATTPNLQIVPDLIDDNIPLTIKLTPEVDLDHDDLLAASNHSKRKSKSFDMEEKRHSSTIRKTKKDSKNDDDETNGQKQPQPGFRRNFTDESHAPSICSSDDDFDDDDDHPDNIPLRITLTSSSGASSNLDDTEQDKTYHSFKMPGRAFPRRSVSLETHERLSRMTAIMETTGSSSSVRASNKKLKKKITFPANRPRNGSSLSSMSDHHRMGRGGTSHRSASDPHRSGRNTNTNLSISDHHTMRRTTSHRSGSDPHHLARNSAGTSLSISDHHSMKRTGRIRRSTSTSNHQSHRSGSDSHLAHRPGRRTSCSLSPMRTTGRRRPSRSTSSGSNDRAGGSDHRRSSGGGRSRRTSSSLSPMRTTAGRLKRSTSSSHRSGSDPHLHGGLSSLSLHGQPQQRISLNALVGGRYVANGDNNSGGDLDSDDCSVASFSSIKSNRSSFGTSGRNKPKRGGMRRSSSFIAGSKIRRHDGTNNRPRKVTSFDLMLK